MAKSDNDWGSKSLPTDAARLLRREPSEQTVLRDRSVDKTHAEYDGGEAPKRRRGE